MVYIIESFLDWPHPPYLPSPEWIQGRMKLFHDYTLQSILNQSFQNFEIWMQCNPQFREISENYKWHDRVQLVYDKGRSRLARFKDNHIVVTRIDSDDLMHRDAMLDVSSNVITSDKRECLIFRYCLLWDRISKYIAAWHRVGPPFHTHIFPKQIYQNLKQFESLHFVSHGHAAGARSSQTIELSRNKIVVVQHSANGSLVQVGKVREVVDIEVVKRRLKGNFITCNHNEMVRMLNDFGITKEKVI